MSIESITNLISIQGLFTLLVIFLLALLGFYTFNRLFRRNQSDLEELERKKQEIDREALDLLDRARDEAFLTTSQANEKAVQVVKDARFMVEKYEKDVDNAVQDFIKRETIRLEHTSLEVLKSYRSMTDEARESYIRNLDMLSKEMSEDARKGLARFQNMLQEEIERYQSVLEERVGELQKTAEEKAEEYKKIVLTRIDDSIYGVISIVAKRILGKTIDLEEHQQLILRALDEAKKEGFFK